MRHRPIQTNFTAGELSPRLEGRVDMSQYANGVSSLENFLILPHGGVTRRHGFTFASEVKDSSKKVRLIPFEFSTEQAYVLEFGNQYIRFYKDNAIIVEDDTPSVLNGNFEDTSGTADWDNWTETAGDGAIAEETTDPYWGNKSVKLTAGATANTEITQAGITTIAATKYYLTFWTKGDGTNAGRYSIYDVTNAGYISTNQSTGVTGTSWEKFQVMFTTPAGCVQIRIELECPSANGGVAYFDLASVDGYPYQQSTPYLEADLFDLYYTQSADQMFIVHKDYEPKVLSRLAHNSWTLLDFEFEDGPWLDENLDVDHQITPTVLSGTGGLTSNKDTWDADHVGALWRLKLNNEWGYVEITSFTNAKTVGMQVIGDDLGGIDDVTNGDMELDSNWADYNTPTVNERSGAQSHAGEYSRKFTADAQNDGIKSDTFSTVIGQKYFITVWYRPTSSALMQIKCRKADDSGWQFEDNAVSGTVNEWNSKTFGYTATVAGSGAYIVVAGNAAGTWYVDDVSHKHVMDTSHWREGAWSPYNGYPGTITFFEGRLFLAGSPEQPQTIWGSAIDDFTNFTPGTENDEAVQYTLASDQVNSIQWLAPSTHLLIGTAAGEFRMHGGADNMITPSNVAVKSPTTFGGRLIRPVRIGNSVIFVQRAGKKLREYSYSLEIDNFKAIDLTILSEHITGDGIVAMDYQQEPDSILWAVREDGTLLGLTYERDHKVVGWHRHPLDGEVESVCVIPATTGDRDEVWASIKRTVDGSTVRYIEYMDPNVYSDSSLSYSGSATTQLAGLEHLEGEEVVIVGDGAIYEPQTVSEGKIAIDPSAEDITVGLTYTSYLKTMRLEVDTLEGTSQGRRKRWTKIQVRVYETLGVKILGEQIPFRSTEDLMGEPPPAHSGIIEKSQLGWDLDGQIEIQQEQPLPITVLSIMGIIDIND